MMGGTGFRNHSFLGAPATATTTSRSVIRAMWPVDSWRESAYSWAKSASSSRAEYFLRITSPPRSTKISRGSPSRMRSVLRISLGMTTRPRSSIRRTMPVAFIPTPPCGPSPSSLAAGQRPALPEIPQEVLQQAEEIPVAQPLAADHDLAGAARQDRHPTPVLPGHREEPLVGEPEAFVPPDGHPIPLGVDRGDPQLPRQHLHPSHRQEVEHRFGRVAEPVDQLVCQLVRLLEAPDPHHLLVDLHLLLGVGHVGVGDVRVHVEIQHRFGWLG